MGTHTGWTLGAGVEHAFTDNFTGRVEYRYSNFGIVENHNPAAIFYGKHDLTSSTLRVGISYKLLTILVPDTRPGQSAGLLAYVSMASGARPEES